MYGAVTNSAVGATKKAMAPYGPVPPTSWVRREMPNPAIRLATRDTINPVPVADSPKPMPTFISAGRPGKNATL